MNIIVPKFDTRLTVAWLLLDVQSLYIDKKAM